MPRRSRSNSPSPKKSESKKATKSHKRVSTSPSSSSSTSSTSSSPSRSRSPPHGKRKRSSLSAEKKPSSQTKVKAEPQKSRAKESENVKKEKKHVSRSHSRERKENGGPKRESRRDGGKDRPKDGKDKGREAHKGTHDEDERGVKRESKSERKARTNSPLALGGRRWDDDSVKKENELGGWGGDKDKDKSSSKPPTEKLKPDFAPSGVLDEERHTVNGINLNYSEPPDARQPDAKWRLYVFKGDKQLEPLAIHRQSAYIVGRERKIAHLPIDHPSCSKQHSVIQFRIKRVGPATADEEAVTAIRPYIIDLNSTNGTMLNGKKIDPAKYYELLEEDVLKFGHSTREYVLLKADAQVGPATLD